MLGIPYNTKPETQAVYYTRDNLKRVYELIEEDLTKGLPLLKDETYEVPKYHLQKRQPAFCSSFLSIQRDWDKVIEYTSNVLGANPQKKNYVICGISRIARTRMLINRIISTGNMLLLY